MNPNWRILLIWVRRYEFLYLNYFHPKWLDWAKSMWEKHSVMRKFERNGVSFETLVEAYKKSNLNYLVENASAIESFKQILTSYKSEICKVDIDKEQARRLMYL